MALSNDQQKAMDQFIKFLASPDNEMALMGHSGTGKTHLVNDLIAETEKSGAMIRLLSGNPKDGIEIHCTATTNKAAGVLQQSTNRTSKTIHSLLALKIFNNFKDGTTNLRKTKDTQILRDSLVIIDEASMENMQLLKIVRESTLNCKVLHVLDPYQLLTVQETSCTIADHVMNQAILKETQRFASGGPIAQLAEQYRQCIDTLIIIHEDAERQQRKPDPALIRAAFPQLYAQGNIIQRPSSADFQDLVNKQFKGFNGANDAKIVAWTNTKVTHYNDHIRRINGLGPKFKVGEFVVTNKPIFNDGGTVLSTDTISKITNISNDHENKYGVLCWRAELDNWIEVFIPCDPQVAKQAIYEAQQEGKNTRDWHRYFHLKQFFSDLRPIHASTVHKSQGSTYGKVFINLADIGKNHNAIEVARLLYVATTRASDEVILYGQLPYRYGG